MNISELKSATEQYYLSYIKRLWLSSSEQGKCLYAGKGLIHSKVFRFFLHCLWMEKNAGGRRRTFWNRAG